MGNYRISTVLSAYMMACDSSAWHYIRYAMAQAVSRRPPTADARVRSWVSPCEICGGQSGTGTGFPPVNFIPPVLHYGNNEKKTAHLALHLHHKGCTISLKASVHPLLLLRGPSKIR
jgi:hypothetical protein